MENMNINHLDIGLDSCRALFKLVYGRKKQCIVRLEKQNVYVGEQ